MEFSKNLLNQISDNSFKEKILILVEQDLQPEEMAELCSAIAQNTHIEILNFDGTFIGGEGAILLSKSSTIKSLYIQNCGISDIGITALIKNLKSLTTLLASSNLITDEGLVNINESKTLKNLNLSNSKITWRGVNVIARNNSIEFLNLSQNLFHYTNDIPEQPLDFSTNFSIKKINLSGSGNLGSIETFGYCKSLECLDLSYCKFSHISIDGLAKTKTIKILNLSYCNLNDSSANDLTNIESLQELNLSGNNFTNNGAKILYQSKIQKINLYGNKIEFEADEEEECKKKGWTPLAFIWHKYRKDSELNIEKRRKTEHSLQDDEPSGKSPKDEESSEKSPKA